MPLPTFSLWKSPKDHKAETSKSVTLPQRTEGDLKRELNAVLTRFSQIDASGNVGGAIDLKRATLLKQCHEVYQNYRQLGGAEHKQLEAIFKQKDIVDAMDPFADSRNSKALESGVRTVVAVTEKLKASSTSKPKV